MLFKSADKSRFFWVILGISSTVAERKKPNFCEEKREKKFFRKQAAAAVPMNFDSQLLRARKAGLKNK